MSNCYCMINLTLDRVHDSGSNISLINSRTKKRTQSFKWSELTNNYGAKKTSLLTNLKMFDFEQCVVVYINEILIMIF